ncbi:hypothetical protein ANN_00535 [Periplaneta americana]|uniref:Uncharacterized protein n=1 Tax=Periplaneta americana TaxID=6978 RepID=A0ABQ8TR36_PERAM|nr:hypothetical protein ANN_00535 [Periplaneta americana]
MPCHGNSFGFGASGRRYWTILPTALPDTNHLLGPLKKYLGCKRFNTYTIVQRNVCLDHVGPTHWEKKHKMFNEKVVGRFPERDWSAVDENSEGQAGRSYQNSRFQLSTVRSIQRIPNLTGPVDNNDVTLQRNRNKTAGRIHGCHGDLHDVIRLLIPALYENQSDSLMATDGACHHLCKLMAPVRHWWSISDSIGEIRNTVMPSDCSALRFGLRSKMSPEPRSAPPRCRRYTVNINNA